jgi:hypothetical protein
MLASLTQCLQQSFAPGTPGLVLFQKRTDLLFAKTLALDMRCLGNAANLAA